MFTILGGDGKEYGPVTLDQIRAWIAAGRANLDTRARAAGTADEWRRLGDFPEFGGANDTPPFVHQSTPPAAQAITPLTLVGQEPAERGTRLLAMLLDRSITLVCALPGLALLGMSFIEMVVAASRGHEPDFSTMDVTRLLLGLILLGCALSALFIVQVVMISMRGQSIGKRILGIRIVRFSDGSNPGFVNGWLLRSLVPGIVGAIPYIGWMFIMVDLCFIFREDRRCLHDLMADTRVVKV